MSAAVSQRPGNGHNTSTFCSTFPRLGSSISPRILTPSSSFVHNGTERYGRVAVICGIDLIAISGRTTRRRKSRWGPPDIASISAAYAAVPKFLPAGLTIEQSEALLSTCRVPNPALYCRVVCALCFVLHYPTAVFNAFSQHASELTRSRAR